MSLLTPSARAAALRPSAYFGDSAGERVRERLRRLYPLTVAALLSMVVGLSIVRGGISSAILIAACVGIAMLPVFLALGFRALPIWAVITPIAYPFLRYPPGRALVSFDRIWIVAMLAVVLLQVRQPRRARESKVLTWAFVWLVVSYGLRSILTSNDRADAIEMWIEAIVLPAALFAVVRSWATDRSRVTAILGATAIAGVVISLLGIGEHVLGFELASRSGGQSRYDTVINLVRVSGPYSAPEPYALSLISCFAATLTWIQLRGRVAFLIGGSAAAIQLVAIFLSYFRAAWIAAAIVIIACVAVRPRRAARNAGMAALAIVLLYAAFAQVEQSSTVSERLSGTVANQNVSGRFAAYQQGLQVFKSSPFVGVGVGQYATAAISRASAVEVGGVNALPEPHSSFVGLLAEQGVVGFLPLVAVMIATYFVLHRLGKRARSREEVLLYSAAGGASLGYIVMSLTLTMLIYGPSNAFYAVMLGLATAQLDRTVDRDADEERRPAPTTTAGRPAAATLSA